ncbi:rod shape-determining protein MreC [Calothrix sp. NIES-3974]|uniref:rod shape-determining protein MreC n=1 Tax=Calothrix sp. NIES-3974 TaxID=2005462 RepID=UPI000B62321B|nr:rod shape-determining protein MreC [Calothrix sp. NIES-3974]BAZ04864.1 rod shape-determining protein MreC [Calothrix sp. NIES-3974]
MYTARRWWERRGLQISLLGLVVGGALILRQTQGAALWEIYQGVTGPLQEALSAMPSQQEQLNDARIMELQTQVVRLQSENENLRKLNAYIEKDPRKVKPIIARVIARSGDNWWQQVTLNRGSSEGVEEGSIVQAEGGLIGRIESVTSNTSRVLLVSDFQSQIGVTIGRTGAKGVLRGNGSSEAILEFYEKVPNVKIGDLVSTSTYSQKFPSGLSVGQIKSLDLERLPASAAQVELFPPIRSLDWVKIYPNPENKLEQTTEKSSTTQPK